MNKNALENFEKNYKPSAKKSVFLEYIEDIEYLLSKGFSRKQVYEYLQQTYRIVETIDALYKFLKKHNLKPFLKNIEPAKPATTKTKTTKEPEQKQEQSKDKYEVKTEEENPLTYEEYSKDYDEAIEVLNPEQSKKTGFVFRKDAWRKLTKEEFKRAEWLLATKPIAYWQIDKQKGVYYKTIRNLKNECIKKGHDLRRYLAYLSSLRNRKDEDPVVNSLEFFIRKVMDFGS